MKKDTIYIILFLLTSFFLIGFALAFSNSITVNKTVSKTHGREIEFLKEVAMEMSGYKKELEQLQDCTFNGIACHSSLTEGAN